MSRPCLPRKITNLPSVTWFKPVGVPLRHLDEVVLTLDEVEAVRLADVRGLYQEEVAEQMQVSRPTVGRILTSARKKIAEALVLGKAIRFEGGQVYTEGETFGEPCCNRRSGHGCRASKKRRAQGGREKNEPIED